jgi:hypothetical protein
MLQRCLRTGLLCAGQEARTANPISSPASARRTARLATMRASGSRSAAAWLWPRCVSGASKTGGSDQALDSRSSWL